MASAFLDHAIALLRKTPQILAATLEDLPERWLAADEGPDTWSPYVILGHLIHGEETDWMPRVRRILEYGSSKAFEPFDREAQLHQAERPSTRELLSSFATLRAKSLEELDALGLEEKDLDRQGLHPALGPVTLRQLLATWTAHDQAHLVQIHRIFARQYQEEVGPWAEYLSVLRPATDVSLKNG